MMERIERSLHPAPDRRGARGGELLAAYDRRKPGKARLALAERRHAGARKDRLQPRILPDQRGDALVKVGRAGPACAAEAASARRKPGHPRLPGRVELRFNWHAFLGAMLQDVDGRDKRGHDEFLNMPPPVFRFAPSPNGFLHLGHAYSALL